MTRRNRFWTGAAIVIILFLGSPAIAEQEGQADLDKATELQLTADSLGDLDQVVSLCESALRKGLDEENTAFAKQLLASTSYQYAKTILAALLDPQRRGPRPLLLRRAALQSLDKAIENNPDLAEAHLLICQLEGIRGGDRDKAYRSAEQAVRIYGDEPKKLAQALLWRARLGDDPKKQVADFQEAIKADPTSSEAWQALAAFHFARREFEQAASAFNKLIENNADNVGAHLALAETLVNLDKPDEALKHADKALELQPDSSSGYTLRARIKAVQDKRKEAIEDLDRALEKEPQNLAALLLRGELHLLNADVAKAREDVDRALAVRPGLILGILLRSRVQAVEQNYDAAIGDMELLLQNDPKNVEWRLQLAMYYSLSERPRRAIKEITAILDEDKDNVQALRARGDALLSVGKHAEAIADFNAALKLNPDHSGLLNNLAWVLATSPDDELRDGKRAIELATKACELTDYQRPHILSTLASGYAETGDFETAIKWSSKAVELGEDDLKEQLQQELDSYKQKKPWRERQEVKEKPDIQKRELLET